jgi:hypothetical protein
VTLGVAVLAASVWSISLAGQGNMVQTHIGHVMESFNGTPMNMGLLPTAMAEAKIAAQHAGLAAKSTTLAMMQTHAGHVLNTIDPTVVAQGPGLGYGLKKAATGAATHADLAGKAPEANAGVKTHAMHVNAAAKNAAAMADEVAALAQKIRASTSMEEAAKLAADMQAKAEQITSGVDVDKNGAIGWDAPEGGLMQAQMHMGLMKTAAGQ